MSLVGPVGSEPTTCVHPFQAIFDSIPITDFVRDNVSSRCSEYTGVAERLASVLASIP